MSLDQENQIDYLNNIIEEQSIHIKDLTARINEQAATIEDLRALVAELRS